ncbi:MULTISPECIES: HNH endonuclease [Photorhabdus]|uniref:Putative HNH nuclease YajD n=1 Tax=Photorhabdus luminescens subsp. mexicana TaxID=2100167 RepID=A0A4R4J3J2_PHOLU|nr:MULTISPECIES: HNH endonuclease signature motif containing protein [Photorhabdus]TDB48070.1 HNH endonuclease [Photorhabdus luminescens subsp. mexicana]
MPARIPRACRKRGCAHTTTDRSGYCTAHQNTGWENHQRGKSRHERGYGNKWDVIRTRILKRDNYLCQDCLRKDCLRNGRAVTATTVDHIIPKARGGTDDDSNLQSLCWPCHRRKTATERMR